MFACQILRSFGYRWWLICLTVYYLPASKLADKPDSVSPTRRLGPTFGSGRRSSIWDDGCPSPHAAYPELEWDGPPHVGDNHKGRPYSLLLGLAPGGGCLAARVATDAGGLLHHLFTITGAATRALPRLSTFLWSFSVG